MKQEFIPYDLALELKELGFNEPCFGYWNIDPYLPKPTFNLVKPFDHEWCISAPLYQQAFRWFREKYKLHFWIEPNFKNQYKTEGYVYYVKNNCPYSIDYATYEEAELACLNKLIEIIKNK